MPLSTTIVKLKHLIAVWISALFRLYQDCQIKVKCHALHMFKGNVDNNAKVCTENTDNIL